MATARGVAGAGRAGRARGARARRAARAGVAALAALAAAAGLAGPAAARRRERILGVVAAETCTWAPDASGGTLELSGVQISQVFSEAPRRGAGDITPAEVVVNFVKRRRRRRKNVAVTAWSSGDGGAAAGSPVYLLGALASAEAGAGSAASLRLRLEQAPAQAGASRPPPAAVGAPPLRSCSAFLDPPMPYFGQPITDK